jgi:hypothetical protein
MKRDWTPVAVFLALTFGLGFAAKSCMDHLAEAPRKAREEITLAVRDASAAVKEIFQLQPQVFVQETLIQGQSAPVAELAVLEQDFPLRFEWTHQWLGSSKQIRVSATWRAKAGFDLMKPFRLDIDPETRAVSADLPAAEILSVEQQGDLKWEGESGWWNRLSEADREGVLRDFKKRAREKIESSDLAGRAQAEAGRRLQDLLDRQEGRKPFEFRFRIPHAPEAPRQATSPRNVPTN